MLKENIKWSKRSEVTKNIVKLISGSTIAQVISIAISPFLTRMYSPEDFGVFTLIASIFGMLALIAGGRYELAILLPKKKVDAANTLLLALSINCLFSIAVGIILLILDVLGVHNMGFWFYMIPLFVFFLGSGQSINAWFNRQKKYKELAMNRIATSSVTNGGSYLSGFLALKVNGLLGGALAGSFFNLLLLLTQVKKDFVFIQRSASFKRIKELAKKYNRFPLINSFQSLLDASQINGLIYLITILFGKQVVGIFSIAVRILFIPVNFIGSAISQVFYQQASLRYQNGEPILPIAKKTTKKAALIMSVVLLVILIFGPDLFAFVFGEVWRDSGVYAQLLCPWICLDFIRSPLSQIPLILGRQKEMLYFSMVSNVMILLLVIISGIYFKNLLLALGILSIFQTIYLYILITWLFRITARHDQALLNSN